MSNTELRSKMREQVTFSLILILSVTPLCGQLNLLTVREAESLIERIPAVLIAERNGGCPESSPMDWGEDRWWFRVREACGPRSGMLIGNYLVNRRTGTVTTTGDHAESLVTLELSALSTELARQARARALTDQEAACLARQAARALPGWSDNDAQISVTKVEDEKPYKVTFVVARLSASRPVKSTRLLSVDLGTTRVRDEQTGLDISSEHVGSLISTFTELRRPGFLSDEDTLAIALLIPSLAGRLKPGCRLTTGGAFRSQEAIIGLTCDGHQSDTVAVAVNIKTGTTVDANTRKVLDSVESLRLADQLLNRNLRVQSETKEQISAVCR